MAGWVAELGDDRWGHELTESGEDEGVKPGVTVSHDIAVSKMIPARPHKVRSRRVVDGEIIL